MPRNLPASSREKPKVSCVRSLVPNEKNCASAAISSAVTAPRGTSIIVPDEVLELDALLLHDVGGHAVDDGLLIAQLLDEADQRDHDLGNDLQAFLVQLRRRLEDGARLHLGDLGIGDPEAHAAVAEHRVELVQLLDAAPAACCFSASSAAWPCPSPRAWRSPPSGLRAWAGTRGAADRWCGW